MENNKAISQNKHNYHMTQHFFFCVPTRIESRTQAEICTPVSMAVHRLVSKLDGSNSGYLLAYIYAQPMRIIYLKYIYAQSMKDNTNLYTLLLEH